MRYIQNEYVPILTIYLISSCIAVVFLVHSVYSVLHQKEVAKTQTPTVNDTIVFNKKAFLPVQVEGKAYVVYDLLTHEVIASKNETAQLPLASLTKVMTAISSTLHTSKDEKITITKKSIEDGFDLGLKNNQVWNLEELLKYTLVFSSNDGAQAVADSFGGSALFLEQMNADAKRLGLNFHFTDPAGRDLHGELGGRGDAVDVAKLFGIARKQIPDILDATTKKRQTVEASTGKVSGIPNTNQEIQTIPGAEASKTGFTNLAGGNLGIIVDVTVGHPIAIIVLGSTREGRFKDVDKLYKALRESLLSN